MAFVTALPYLPDVAANRFDFHDLSKNRNITIQDILLTLERKWDWCQLSRNSSISLESIFENFELPWCLSCLAFSRGVSQKDMSHHPSPKWSPFFAYANSSVHLSEVNCDIHIDIFARYNPNVIELFHHHLWSSKAHVISQNPHLPIDLVHKNPHACWDWYALSNHPELSFALVLCNIDKNWSWRHLSKHPCVSLSYILSRPDLPWIWKNVSQNPSIRFEDIIARPDLPWDWRRLSSNPTVTISHVIAHPEIPWSLSKLCRHIDLHHIHRAANTIARCYRLWMWRRRCYFNIHNDIGRAHLIITSRLHTA